MRGNQNQRPRRAELPRNPSPHQNLFLRSRISAKTCHAGWPASPTGLWDTRLREYRLYGLAGGRVVRAVTSPVNERSVAFHRALGFEVERVDRDYDGRGESRVLLVRRGG